MIINFVAAPSKNDLQTIINVTLEKGDIIKEGDYVEIPLTDGRVVKQKITKLFPHWDKRRKGKPDFFYFEDTYCEFMIEGIASTSVADKNFILHQKWLDDHKNDVCLTPFMQLQSGNLSIYDFIDENYTIPEKVIAYLQTETPYLMCCGDYEHPFKKGQMLLGPYMFTDGHYYWDRDTWKYVQKYGLKLSQEFVDYVMSDAGSKYLEKYYNNHLSWEEIIQAMKHTSGSLCLLPSNNGDNALDNF